MVTRFDTPHNTNTSNATSQEVSEVDSRDTQRLGGNNRELNSFQKEFSNNIDDNLDTALQSSTSTPERLMAMYLAGKLSQGELVFKLKNYNMVTADTMIREAKHCPTAPIDYVEAPKAAVDPITHEEDKPLQGASGNKSDEDAGKGLQPARDEHTKEQEKENEEELQEQIKEEETQQVIQTEEQEQINRQAVQAQQQAERKRKQEEEEFEGTAEDRLEDRTKKGSLDSAQKKLKGAKRHIEEQKRKELLMLAQVIAKEGRSEEDKKEEDELLMSLLDEWELFAEDDSDMGNVRIPIEDEDQDQD